MPQQQPAATHSVASYVPPGGIDINK